MPDSAVPINAPTTVGQSMASFLDAGGEEHEKVIVEWMDAGGQPIKTSAANPLPVTDAAALAALAVLVAGQQSDGLTDAELRASPVPITGTVAVTGGGDATAANQVTGNTSLASIKTNTDKIPALGQALAAASVPVVLTAAEETILSAILTIADFDTKTGSLTETAPATDTASSGLNGRLQRIAQRLTSLIALYPTALGAGGGFKVDGSGTALPISGTVTVTGAGDATAANQTSQITQETAFNTVMGLIADAAVTAGATGSISAKLRAISRDLVANIVLAAGANIIGKVGVDQTTPGTTNLVALSAETTKVIGTVNNAAGSNLIGKVGIDQTTPGTTNAVVEASAAAILAKLTAAAASFVKLEDVASVDADAGVPMLAVRQSTPANTSGSNGDYEFLQMNGGKLWVQAGATQKPSIGATVVLAVTALQSMATSTTVGWKSVRTSNLATLANDYEVMLSCPMANTAPASSKSVQLYVIPWYTSDAGTTWFANSGGTATLPTSADATYTIASPHNFLLLGVLNYTTQNGTVQGTFLLSNCFGNRMPDAFSFFVLNDSGAATSTGCILDITPINDILV